MRALIITIAATAAIAGIIAALTRTPPSGPATTPAPLVDPARAARANSRTGKDLARRCNEFSNARTDNKDLTNRSDFAEQHQRAACRRYYEYLNTGKLPTR